MSDTTVFLPPDRRPRRGVFIPPLLIVPLVLYNLAVFSFMGGSGAGWTAAVGAVPMVSGVSWSITWGDLLVILGLVALCIEVIKSTNTGRSSVLEHIVSTVVFIVFLVEFLLAPAAATSVFFILMIMSFIDVVAGFTVSITSAGRDVNMG